MKQMDRKSCTLALMAILSLSLCKLQMVVAQVPPQGNQHYGTFGDRTLGQPLVPAPSTFGGRILTAPDGSFLGLSNDFPASATPGLQNNTGVPAPNGVARPALNAGVSPQSPAAERDAPELSSIMNLAPLLVPKTNGPEGTVRTAPTLGLRAPGTPGRGSAPPVAGPQQPYYRSPELSDRLTQIARTKGLLFGPAIDVYVSNNVALIQGAVGTPSDSTQLATALAHEPGVLRIDNRLVALGSIQAAAQDPSAGQGPPGGGQQGSGGAETQHEAGPNTGKTADAATKFSGGPISIINPATNTATLSYSLGGDPFTIPPGYGQNFHEDRAWAIRFSPAPSGMRSNTGFIRAFTRLPVRTTVGNCTTASCHERSITRHVLPHREDCRGVNRTLAAQEQAAGRQPVGRGRVRQTFLKLKFLKTLTCAAADATMPSCLFLSVW